jgi:hypothetical protein
MFDEPKDMFAGTDKAPAPAQVSAPEPQTIAPPPTRLPPSYGAVPPQITPGGDSSSLSHSGAIKIFVIIGVVLIIFGVSGFFAYRIMVQPADDSSVVNSISDDALRDDSDNSTNDELDDAAQTADEAPSNPEPVTNPGTLLDSDGDGLTNARELEVGTSVTKSDTDGDGLGDREEVEVYGTDPRNPDTDGDGYLDGQEVSSGYNPNGSGRLFAVPDGS